MPETFTGVYPCYKNQFKIGTVGAQTLNTIADMESTFGSDTDMKSIDELVAIAQKQRPDLLRANAG